MTAFSHAFQTMTVTLNGMATGFFRLLPNLVIAMVVIMICWLISGAVRAGIHRATTAHAHTHANVGIVLGRLAQWLVLFVGFLVALAIVAPSVKPANIVSVLGIGSVAIGFAFKDILQNFIAGVLLLLREPFKVGDQIIIKDFEGTVEDIDTRSTRIRTYDGRRVIIPNGELYTSSFTVNTAFGSRRTQYDIGIGYGDDVENARKVILDTLKRVPGVLSDPPPDAIVVDLAASTVNLRARWWTETPRKDVLEVQDRVLTEIKASLTKAGIDLPFPVQTLLFHDQTDAYDCDRAKQREGWPAGANPPPPRNVPEAIEKRHRANGESSVADRSNGALAPADASRQSP